MTCPLIVAAGLPKVEAASRRFPPPSHRRDIRNTTNDLSLNTTNDLSLNRGRWFAGSGSGVPPLSPPSHRGDIRCRTAAGPKTFAMA